MSELSVQRQRLILVICCMSLFMGGLDVTIVNVALPSIQRDFHASVSDLQWIIDAYTLVLACLLILAGSLADRFGRRKVFQIGLALFSASSLLCSVAPGLGWLVAFRTIQAVGASMLNPVALSIIYSAFSDPRARGRAMGAWGSVFGISLASGPVLGGILVSSIGWRAIFWINVPVGITAIVLTRLFVPESRAERPRQLDFPGQVLVFVTLASLTYGIIEGPRRGWSSPLIIGLFVLCIVSLVALIRIELRRREALIDPRFFRSAPFAGASVMAIMSLASIGGFLFLNTLYLQDIRHFSPFKAGLSMLPMAVTVFFVARFAGHLVGTKGPRRPLILAGPPILIAAIMLERLSVHTSILYIEVAYVIFGVGFGFVNPPISSTAMAGMPPDQGSVAAAVASASRQLGATIGVAVTGSIIAGMSGAAILGASHGAWFVIAGCGAGVGIVGYISTTTWAYMTAQRNGKRLEAEEAARQAPWPSPPDAVR